MRSEKRLYAIDIFDADTDRTENSKKDSMAHIYRGILQRKSQGEVFKQITRGLKNLVVIAADSKEVCLPSSVVCFAFIDGNHSPEHVESDFYLVWQKLLPGGVVAFHDYGFDLPQVTATLDMLCAKHRQEIIDTRVLGAEHILAIRKR